MYEIKDVPEFDPRDTTKRNLLQNPSAIFIVACRGIKSKKRNIIEKESESNGN